MSNKTFERPCDLRVQPLVAAEALLQVPQQEA
jgi:hypothetical protein